MAPKTKRLKISDYVPIREQTSPLKIGGRLNTFVLNWLEITDDAFVLSVVRNGYQISVLESFPGVLREVTKSSPKVEVFEYDSFRDRYTGFKGSCSSGNRQFRALFVPDFLCSKTIGGSSSHSQFEEYQSLPSRSEVSYGNFKFNFSSVIEPRLGSIDRFKRCLISCSDSQVVHTSPRFSISGSSVPVCGASVRA